MIYMGIGDWGLKKGKNKQYKKTKQTKKKHNNPKKKKKNK